MGPAPRTTKDMSIEEVIRRHSVRVNAFEHNGFRCARFFVSASKDNEEGALPHGIDEPPWKAWPPRARINAIRPVRDE